MFIIIYPIDFFIRGRKFSFIGIILRMSEEYKFNLITITHRHDYKATR
jgi:hypothetical protein